MPGFGAITPTLRMFDEDNAREFYVGYLGFQIDFEHRFGDHAPLYMGLKLGLAELHLSEHHGDARPGARVTIEIRDLVGYWRSLDAKDYRYAKPGAPQVQSWGEADLPLADPFGNKVTFFERT